MSIELWLAYVAATVVLLLIPGPTVLTVVSYSVAYGGRVTVALVAAVALGDSTAVAVSLFGLGTILATSAFWFSIVKWVGGLYLLYLGVRLLQAGVASSKIEAPPAPESRWRLFANTYIVTALNPKSIVFFVAFLPQFIDPNAVAAGQFWILAATFVILATVGATAYAIFADLVRELLHSRTSQRKANVVSGSLLSAAGVWVLLARRPV